MRLGNNIYLEPYLTLNFEWNTGLLLEASRPSRLEDKQVPGIDFCSESPDPLLFTQGWNAPWCLGFVAMFDHLLDSLKVRIGF